MSDLVYSRFSGKQGPVTGRRSIYLSTVTGKPRLYRPEIVFGWVDYAETDDGGRFGILK